MSLIEQLFKKKIIDEKKTEFLKSRIKISGKSEEEILLENKVLTEKFLFDLKSRNLKIPFREVSFLEVPTEILKLIPEESATYYKMVPLSKRDNIFEVGMIYPEDIKAQEALKFLIRQTELSFKVFLINFSGFDNISKQYRTLKGEVGRALEALEKELKVERVVRPRAAEFARMAEEAPIIKVVSVILKHAVDGRASDIHIEPTREKLRVRFRKDGVLHSSIILPLRIHPAVIARIKILSNLRIDETRIPQDGRFSTKILDRLIDYRISTFPTTLGEKIAIRVLDPTIGLKSFDELGISGMSFEAVKEAIKKPYGLILTSGPTGCGKTTTMYAIIQALNKEGINLVTLEDPVEYFISGINQSQIKPEIGYNFAMGLRHMIRQDPDIIMVGEIRDEESASLVTHAALTGHVVLSSLHTANSLGVIPRLIDMGIRPFLISPILNIALAQRLIRVLCPHCKKKIKPKKAIKELILEEINAMPPNVKKDIKIPSPFYLWEAVGCKRCEMKGLKGRTGIFEVLKMTDQLAEIILKEPTETNILEEAKRQGMITMKQDGILKVLKGITTIEEVLRVAEEK